MNAGQERLFELLASRATEGLSASDSQRLESLLEESPQVDAEGFDRAAAAVHLALLGPEMPVPEALKWKLAAASRELVASRHQVEADAAPRRPADRPTPGRPGAFGWWAAAAALVLALAGWWPRLFTATEKTLDEGRTARLPVESLARDPATLRVAWTATEDATAVEASGEVLWNGERQAGYMRIAGLARDDPKQYQYQLWIFDRARDERFPVDGGVFDMPAEGGEVLVPIDAKVAVGEPYLFAITVERPGGVVVSTRERIALLAKAG